MKQDILEKRLKSSMVLYNRFLSDSRLCPTHYAFLIRGNTLALPVEKILKISMHYYCFFSRVTSYGRGGQINSE